MQVYRAQGSRKDELAEAHGGCVRRRCQRRDGGVPEVWIIVAPSSDSDEPIQPLEVPTPNPALR